MFLPSFAKQLIFKSHLKNVDKDASFRKLFSSFLYFQVLVVLVTLLFLRTANANDTSSGETSKEPDELATQLGYRSHFIQANGQSFHIVEKGEGETMVFLHGYPFFWYGWHNLMQHFSDSHRVIAPDNRGYNLSSNPEPFESYHLQHLVTDVAAQIKQLVPGKKVILVGHDWGGTLAWSVAKKHPELLHKLIVINAPPYNTLLDMLRHNPVQRKTSSYMEILKSGKVEQAFAANGPAMLWNYGFNKREEKGELSKFDKDAYFAAWTQPGAMAGALNWYRANIPKVEDISETHYWPHKGAKVDVPSLLIWTEGEKVFVPDVKTETAKVVPNLKVVTLAGSGHAPFLDKPQDVASVISAFMSDNDAQLKKFDVQHSH